MPDAAKHSIRSGSPRGRLRRHNRRRLVVGIGVVVVAAAAFYGGAFLLAGAGVPHNTSVAGVEIGGLSPHAAQEKLRAQLAAKAAEPIKVAVAGQSGSVDPVRAGLTVDYPATVAAAGRRSANPVDLVRSLFAHRRVAPVTSVDVVKLAAEIDALDATIDGGGRDGGISFDGVTPVAVTPVKGLGIDKSKAVPVLRAAYLSSTSPVQLPTKQIDPTISATVVQQVLDTIAKPAVAAPIGLVIGSTTVDVQPAVIAKNLTFKAEAGNLVPVVNGAGIAATLGDALKPLETPGKDASFTLDSGSPVIVPSVPGTKADVEKLGIAIAGVLSQTAPRQVSVPTTGVEPTFTTEAAQSLGIKEMVSTFTTHHPCCAARVTNIHRIADIINGHIVMPGEIFSLNEFVGERDTKRGFVEAPMIEDGLYVDSIGGGISQFATTLYNAVFFAGLNDIEHHPHSYYISRYPAGRESTISYPEPNFIFQNDTPTGILMQTAYTGTSLTVTFWGTKYYDITSTSSPRYAFTAAGVRYNPKPGCESAAGGQGFQIDVTQTFSKDGQVVKKQVLHTKYDPEPVIVCGPAPTTSPSPSTSLSTSASLSPSGSRKP